MNYKLKIAGRDVPVTCELKDSGTLSAAVGDEQFEARYRVISPNHIHLEVGGVGMNVYLADDSTGRLINVGGTTWLVQDADALAQAGPRRKGLKDIPQEVTPPMPSVVVRIMVSEGDRVEKGAGVVVVSAMKMETTLQAPFTGTVLKVNVAEGDKVMPGQILVDIERDESGDGEPQ
jgi:3-methylcrotonyl-CoA carboxylase alpha subunit